MKQAERTESVVFTNMCMIYDGEGNVLVQERKDPNWPGITFPGGHVECGESFRDSVLREVYEETGLKVSKLRLCGVKNWMIAERQRYVVLCYKTNQFEGSLNSSEEGEVKWVKQEELPGMRLAEGMESMMKLFFEEDITEHRLVEEQGVWKNFLL